MSPIKFRIGLSEPVVQAHPTMATCPQIYREWPPPTDKM
jgi:hypothetical protein